MHIDFNRFSISFVCGNICASFSCDVCLVIRLVMFGFCSIQGMDTRIFPIHHAYSQSSFDPHKLSAFSVLVLKVYVLLEFYNFACLFDNVVVV